MSRRRHTASLEPVSPRQRAHRGQCHQDPDHHFDEPQPPGGHTVGQPEEFVGQQQVRPVVLVGEDQRDGDPDDGRHRDPGDGVAQVPQPCRPRDTCEAEPAEVVAGHAEQDVGTAPQCEQLGMRADDQDNGFGAQGDAGFHGCPPMPARRAVALQVPHRHPASPSADVPGPAPAEPTSPRRATNFHPGR